VLVLTLEFLNFLFFKKQVVDMVESPLAMQKGNSDNKKTVLLSIMLNRN